MNSTQKLLFMMMLAFGQKFYACEESKVDESEIVDLTSIGEVAPAFRPVLLPPPCPKILDSTNTEGSIRGYYCIQKDSPEFKAHESAVEDFAAVCRDESLQLRYYLETICPMMNPFSEEFPEKFEAFCRVHHCYDHQCYRLYAGQAFLLQPKNMGVKNCFPCDPKTGNLIGRGSLIENKYYVYRSVKFFGGKEVLRKFAAQFATAPKKDFLDFESMSSKLTSKSAVRGLLNRSLGIKSGMQSSVKQELK